MKEPLLLDHILVPHMRPHRAGRKELPEGDLSVPLLPLPGPFTSIPGGLNCGFGGDYIGVVERLYRGYIGGYV